MGDLPRDGLVAVVKRDCPTCVMAAAVLGEMARQGGLTVYTQDDPTFPEMVPERIDGRKYHAGNRAGAVRMGLPLRPPYEVGGLVFAEIDAAHRYLGRIAPSSAKPSSSR